MTQQNCMTKGLLPEQNMKIHFWLYLC
jgi:hypothetical protein